MCCGELSCPCGPIAGSCGKTGILMGIFLLDHNLQKKIIINYSIASNYVTMTSPL